MKIMVSAAVGELEFMFFKIRDKHNNGREKINTKCVIHLMNDEDSIVGMGFAYLSHLDQYDKVKGKKVALAKAIVDAGNYHSQSLRIEFDKQDRRTIWEAFFKEFPRKR